MVNYFLLGQRIKARRRSLKITQEQMAVLLGRSASFVGHIERGTRKMSLETFCAVCNTLKIRPDELLG